MSRADHIAWSRPPAIAVGRVAALRRPMAAGAPDPRPTNQRAAGRPDTTQTTVPRTQMALVVALAAGIQAFLGAEMGGAATLLGYVVLGVAFVTPATGLAALALLVALRAPIGFGPLGFHTVLAVSILLGCLAELARDRGRVHLDPLWAILLGFGVYAGLQVVATPADVLDQQRLFAQSQLFELAGGGAMMLAAQYLLRRRDWGQFLDCVIVSAVVASSLVIASVSTQGATQASLPGMYGVSQLFAERPAGPFNLTNYFGLFAAMACLVAIYRASSVQSWHRVFSAIGAIWILAALMLSYSRGALVAFAVGIIILAFSRSRLLGCAAVAGCLVVAAVGYSGFYDARFAVTNPNSLTQAQDVLEASDASRFAGGAVSLQLFQREPVFGIGFGQYHFVSPLYVGGTDATYSHNWYLNVLAEQGLVGISLLLMASIAVVAMLRGARPSRRNLAFSVLAAFAAGNLFTESPTQLQTSGIAWLVVGGALASVEMAPRLRDAIGESGIRAVDSRSRRATAGAND